MAIFQSRDFQLECGVSLPELDVAYEAYGELNDEASNAIVVLHGTTSTHHAAGIVTRDRRKGWWDRVIGPGKLFDTDHYCVIAPNMLGSSYGSTGPASTDPATGRPYGTSFPDVTLADMVRSQQLMLQSLGVEKLVAVAGQSIGGLLAFQWAVTCPDFMSGVIATDCGPKNLFRTKDSLPVLVDELSGDPNWRGGDYYESGGLEDAMTKLRIKTLKSYQFEDTLQDVPDPAERRKILEETAREWAHEFDPNSLIALMKALTRYNVENELNRIKAKFFYVLADTDEFYPAEIGADTIDKLSRAGVDAGFLEIQSLLGHYATTEEPEKWVPAARAFLAAL
jgi:homoserine O-acetyltransferase